MTKQEREKIRQCLRNADRLIGKARESFRGQGEQAATPSTIDEDLWDAHLDLAYALNVLNRSK